MAGYRITYDGSLVERRDIVQATGTSSLTTQTLFGGTEGNSDVTRYVSGQSVPSNQFGIFAIGQGTSGGFHGWQYVFDFSGNKVATYITPVLNGAVSWEIRSSVNLGTSASVTIDSCPSGNREWFQQAGDTTIQGAIGISTTPGVYTTITGSATLSNRALKFIAGWQGIADFWEVDYVRIFTSGGTITITPSTVTNGIAPTGGSAISATPSTIQDGSVGIAGPASTIEVITEDGGQVAAKCRVSHPAENTENSDIQIKNSRIITAITPSLTTSVTGLDSTNKLQSNRTSLSVKEFLDATEN